MVEEGKGGGRGREARREGERQATHQRSILSVTRREGGTGRGKS